MLFEGQLYVFCVKLYLTEGPDQLREFGEREFVADWDWSFSSVGSLVRILIANCERNQCKLGAVCESQVAGDESMI